MSSQFSVWRLPSRFYAVSAAWILSCTLLTSPSSLNAQEVDRAPWLNSFGRFWGIGWSAGYHANYESRYGFHRYTPTHNVVPSPFHGNQNMVYGANASAMGGANYSSSSPMSQGNFVPTPAPDLNTPANGSPEQAETIVEPPPTWLKQYLKTDAPAGTQSFDNTGITIVPGTAGYYPAAHAPIRSVSQPIRSQPVPMQARPMQARPMQPYPRMR